MRVLLAGNCHVVPLAACLRELLPEAEVRSLWLAPARSEEAAAVRAEISTFDVVCAHSWDTSFAAAEVRGSAGSQVFLPNLVFDGFQPDHISIPQVRGPFANGHSAIIVACYLLGVSPARCATLFNAFVYASLGYFHRFESALRFLLQRATALGMPLDRCVNDWPAPFMYNVYHPKFEPLASAAELLALRIAGKTAAVDWASASARAQFAEEKYVAWPLYPEIAARLELPGEEMRFRYPQTALGMDLPQFITKSYGSYATADRAALLGAVKTQLPIIRELLLSRYVAGGVVAA